MIYINCYILYQFRHFVFKSYHCYVTTMGKMEQQIWKHSAQIYVTFDITVTIQKIKIMYTYMIMGDMGYGVWVTYLRCVYVCWKALQISLYLYFSVLLRYYYNISRSGGFRMKFSVSWPWQRYGIITAMLRGDIRLSRFSLRGIANPAIEYREKKSSLVW